MGGNYGVLFSEGVCRADGDSFLTGPDMGKLRNGRMLVHLHHMIFRIAGEVHQTVDFQVILALQPLNISTHRDTFLSSR